MLFKEGLRKKLTVMYLTVLIAIPLILIVLPSDIFDNGKSICISMLLFNMECYGCGMSRAVQHLIHLDIEAASQFNKLSFIVAPLLLIIWFLELKRIFNMVKLFKY